MTIKHEEFMSVRDEMAAKLDAEHFKRKQRGFNLQAELGAMHVAVNVSRMRRQLAPVTLAAIDMADQMASGHSDYASKFALYCAELAVGLKGGT
jgi:hypothetical protein